MAIAWFICSYKRDPGAHRPTRYCAMDDFTTTITEEGGTWSETEVLGGYALVKVRAEQTTLDTIAGTAGFFRIPIAKLDTQLSSLTTAQRNAIKARLEAMGYGVDELTSTLGNNLGQKTLGDVLRFAASRRLKPRYDKISDVIVCDGAVQTCRAVSSVDADVL